jgi:mevalonate kinase
MSEKNKKISKFYSHGKLLLTGEYLVLSGAKAVALATKVGQNLRVIPTDEGNILWVSFDQEEEVWFSATFDLETFEITGTVDQDRAKFIESLLVAAKKMNPGCFYGLEGVEFNTHLEFDEEWGLGSSSTLINNVALWAEVDAYALLENTIKGSGYDIAVARAGDNIVYALKPIRVTKKIHFDPPFKENIFFIYLNRKQDSASEVKKFEAKDENFQAEISGINDISEKIVEVESIGDFEKLIEEHNTIMSKVLGRPSAQADHPDYKGGVLKYLGAWGGDFMLATGHRNDMVYFMERGYATIVPFADMIK